MKSFALSCVVPFRDFEVLRNNLFISLAYFNSDVQVILVHDTEVELEESQLQSLKSISAEVVYLSGDFKSAARSRNLGLTSATGKWIVFWDSDDYGFAVETQRAIEHADSKEIVICGFIVSETKIGKRVEFSPSKVNIRQLVVTPGIWRVIFRREVTLGKSFSEIPLGEDILFLVSCGTYDRESITIQEIVYEYRLSNSQATRSMNVPIELNRFLAEYSSLLLTQQPASIVPYGIYLRQTLSLLTRTRGKELGKCVKNLIELYGGLDRIARKSLLRAAPIVLTRRLISK